MAAWSLQPGAGGLYTSESFTAASTSGADTLDCSNCQGITVQVSSTGSPGGDIQLEESANGSDWANLGSANAVTDGTLTPFESADGPIGIIRINPTGITAGTDETVTVTIKGDRRWGG